jgi:hypothetical protein
VSDPPSTADIGPTPRTVLVLAQMDGYANGLKPVEITNFLRARGHQVRLVDTYHLSRAGTAGRAKGLPGPTPSRVGVFGAEKAGALLGRLGGPLRRRLSYPFLAAETSVRRRILRSTVSVEGVDLVIVESPTDAEFLLGCSNVPTWYDCPTPWADELLLEGRLTESQHTRMKRRERTVFEGVDYLSFHWESYARYAQDRYDISGRNLVTLNSGCTLAEERARFDSPPRVVYLGSLSSQFIDPPLLSRLSRIYPHIDVYGGPPPDPALGLRYLGWTPPSVLSNYQFGLITCTRDELRRRGFSAKHLQYFAHGLPVLLPRWRNDPVLAQGSVPYDEHSFLAVLEAAGDQETWSQLSATAVAQAKRYSWANSLAPLGAIVERL